MMRKTKHMENINMINPVSFNYVTSLGACIKIFTTFLPYLKHGTAFTKTSRPDKLVLKPFAKGQALQVTEALLKFIWAPSFPIIIILVQGNKNGSQC